jgi:hypothetical protein
MRRLLSALLLTLLCVAAAPGAALTVATSGSTTGQAVTVTLDEAGFITFQMDGGVPVYAYGTTATFIPRTPGTLTITADAGGETATAAVTVTTGSGGWGGGGGSDGDDDGISWKTVTLGTGTFVVTADNSGDEYNVSRQTPLGALDAAGVGYKVDDSYWDEYGSLFVISVKGRENAGVGGWMYLVNGVSPVQGANACTVSDGDEIIWYWSDSMSSTYETSDDVIYLKARITTPDSGSGDDGDEEVNTTAGAAVTERFLLGLPEGATLTLAEWGELFTLDLSKARAAGEAIEIDGNDIIVTRGSVTMIIRLIDFTENGDVLTGIIREISIGIAPVTADLSGIGEAAGFFTADLYIVPVDSLITASLQETLTEETEAACTRAAAGCGRAITSIAFGMEITTGNLEDGTDIGAATIRMAVSPEWVQAHGGAGAVRILHRTDDGSIEMLTTTMVGEDEAGRMIFEAISPGGLSLFVLAALGEETAGTPAATAPRPPADGAPATPGEPEAGTADASLMMTAGLALLSVMVIGAGLYRVWRKKNER